MKQPLDEPYDLDRYLGAWYEIARFPAWFERHQICNTAFYQKKPDGGILVNNTGPPLPLPFPSSAKGQGRIVEGSMWPMRALPASSSKWARPSSRTPPSATSASSSSSSPSPDARAGLVQVRFSKFQPFGPYWVLDTDYETYTVVWSCSVNLHILHVEFAWILARRPHLDPALYSHLSTPRLSQEVVPGSCRQDPGADGSSGHPREELCQDGARRALPPRLPIPLGCRPAQRLTQISACQDEPNKLTTT